MNGFFKAALGLGALAGLATLLRPRPDETASPADNDEEAERLQRGEMPMATGREDANDVLGDAHELPSVEAKHVRAAARHVQGKNTSPEREGMFQDPGDAGTSGSQGSTLGREDHNPIGPHK